jgi:hypothetical protein
MSKISTQVSGGLGAAIKEAKAKINGSDNVSDVETLLNSGAETQKKRKRRTKAEMEAARNAENNSLFDNFEIKEEKPEYKPLTHDEFCELELKKAHDENLENPDFDFRNFYEKGNIVWFVNYSEKLGEKTIHKLYLRTIYPRMMVGSQEKGCCHCIGYKQKDQVFSTSKEADTYFQSLNIVPKYNEKPKRKKDAEEEFIPVEEETEDED